MNVSYALDSLRRNWNNQHWYTTVFNSYVAGRLYRRLKGNDGEFVVEKDWDNLLILDGCRFDLFEEVYGEQFEEGFGGTLSKIRSRGSGSPGYLRENFQGRDLSDTVYVTANPFVYKVLDNPFHHVDHVWMNDWDDDLETVRPDTMVEHAIEAYQTYPNKRLVVHFMQPHHPFIGDFRLSEDRGFLGAKAKSLDEDVPDVKFVWERLREGEVSEDEVWRAYRDNLVLALEKVGKLIEAIPGKHVVTSDHGNAFGERVKPFPTTTYGHGDNLHIPALVDVPWLELPADDRRQIEVGTEESSDINYEEESIEERLTALGYK
ncbi:hypothetical protein [Haloarchaeobius iranensis]|uniref:Sulfatase n=1 Tax=Haloarchaeobius iranensis TaxID=996166 RepID=A0A1H0BVH9_9EURY|nr:hypothetical protein [Haloarchaeobius iranensis]SDN49662.1 hypothetical protein SAMN05192554_1495 [Haloarchaeobius iranensis]